MQRSSLFCTTEKRKKYFIKFGSECTRQSFIKWMLTPTSPRRVDQCKATTATMTTAKQERGAALKQHAHTHAQDCKAGVTRALKRLRALHGGATHAE